jgi:hypothetical protein
MAQSKTQIGHMTLTRVRVQVDRVACLERVVPAGRVGEVVPAGRSTAEERLGRRGVSRMLVVTWVRTTLDHSWTSRMRGRSPTRPMC